MVQSVVHPTPSFKPAPVLEQASATIAPIPLTQLKRGAYGVLVCSGDDATGQTLRAMGLRPECRLRVCRGGRHCIVAIETACGGGCRIGIDRTLAARVLVRPA